VSGRDPAAARFAVIQVLRLSGVALVILGLVIVAGPSHRLSGLPDWVGFVLLIRACVPGEVVVFAAIVLGLALVSETLGPRPRFLLTAFPVFYGVAAALRGVASTTVVAMMACTLGAFTIMSVSTLAVTP